MFENRLREKGFTVLSGGLVDSSQSGAQVGDTFRREEVDFLICYVSTYALSAGVVPVIQRAGVPTLIVSLQPNKAMDYKNGTTFMQLEHDNATSLPEICCALRRANIEPAGMVVGTLYDDEAGLGADFRLVQGRARVCHRTQGAHRIDGTHLRRHARHELRSHYVRGLLRPPLRAYRDGRLCRCASTR